MPPSEFCRNGHERSVVGVYLRPDDGKAGTIRCKACKAATQARYRATPHGQLATQRSDGWSSTRTKRRRMQRLALYEGSELWQR